MNVCSVFGEGRQFKYNLRAKDAPTERLQTIFPDLTSFTYFTRSCRLSP